MCRVQCNCIDGISLVSVLHTPEGTEDKYLCDRCTYLNEGAIHVERKYQAEGCLAVLVSGASSGYSTDGVLAILMPARFQLVIYKS